MASTEDSCGFENPMYHHDEPREEPSSYVYGLQNPTPAFNKSGTGASYMDELGDVDAHNFQPSTYYAPSSYPQQPAYSYPIQYLQPYQGQPGACQEMPYNGPAPDDNLVCSIFVTVFCCWLIGIFAIRKSVECRTAIAVGDLTRAQLLAYEARQLANIGIGVGIACLALTAIIIALRVTGILPGNM